MAESSTKLTIAGADPRNLAEMTAYQEGSVVSRTLLQDESGTLTVFSFDEGQALSEHTVPYNAFIQVLDGQAEITIGGLPCLVNAGEIVLMPGGISHKVRAVKRFKMLLTMFKTKVA
jgi:quercetin dioxygenase-like cupin family protein